MKDQPLSQPDPNRQQKLTAFDRLLTIMDELRENCPWDKKQTMETLRHLTIEETYELGDAIIENDMEEVKKELGDLMLHLVFYARIGSEKGSFDISNVLHSVCDKLVRRHPHIYGDTVATDEKAVKENWEKIKLKEKGNQTVLGGVPKSLPAMVKAMRIQEKAKGAGFDWDRKEQVWEKVQEELQEFQEEIDSGTSQEKINAEFGDILFSLINYARFVDINPEEALERTNKKFISRFNFLEKAVNKDQKELTKMSLDEMNEYWEAAKTKED
ncbi:MAG: nucleoside triphosphate pyrophosphohydrolase [Cyclobacteriaceae bacterium]